jgi:putative copper export protein/mono/diheme cytochrome c family protein
MIGLATIMALVRGLHLAATLSLLGTAGFLAWMLPAAGGVAVGAVPDLLRRRLRRLWWISGLVALLAGVAWFILQSAAIAGAESLSDLLDAIPVVAAHTRYGNVMMVRLGLLAVATLVPLVPIMGGRASVHLTIVLTAVALGLQGLIGHAGATEGAIGDGLVLSEFLHLAAAGLWLGALLPLGLSLWALPPAQAAPVCERFSPIGLGCVLVLAGTGFVQGLDLIGSLPALFGTTYGHFALLKISLFLVALVLAALNRLWLTDRLAAGVASARRVLLASVSVETCVGLAIVTAAAFMASSPPAAHTTPVWPFSWRFSLVTVNEDPDFRREVLMSVSAIGAAIVLMVASLLWRRFRLAALAILVAAVVVFGPSLSLLTVEAYPTSFQTSPTGFSAASIARGQALYGPNCAACHGPDGEGNGPDAAGLRIKPANLTMPHLWEHSDGELFWWLTHGIDDPEGPKGALAMPGFGTSLSADDRWALIDYIRAHNAGLAAREDSSFGIPVRAPAFPVTCAGVMASTTADLRGRAVHLVAADAVAIEVPPLSGISTINVALRDGARPAPGACVAASPRAWTAYAVLADLPPDRLSGAEFLVDPDGWLRALRRPGTAGEWHIREKLVAAIRKICGSPIRQPSGDQHGHHH